MDNNLIIVNDENIIMQFRIDDGDQEYIVYSDTPGPSDDDTVYFAKINMTEEGYNVMRNIENDEEYRKVLEQYNKIIEAMGDDSNEESN